MKIEIARPALEKISEIYDSHKKLIRLAITSGGCQGFNKSWELVDDIDQDDHVFPSDTGALIVDVSTMEIIDGSIVDYEVTLEGQQFVLKLPHVTSTCGCGTSFSF